MSSPYDGKSVDEWLEVTNSLIQAHPLKPDLILDAAIQSWNRLWSTRVGDESVGFPFADIEPPAIVVGYFFEKLFSKELATRLPGQWRGGKGSEKDLHCITDESMSVEMKSSGQLGYKIFGNRSYGQKVENEDAAKKDKSGYYITINFHGQQLTLLRFGWIDASDWQAQKSATGQMAGLGDEVYQFKLIRIAGKHELDGPVQLVNGVGAKAAEALNELKIYTIGDLINAKNLPVKFAKVKAEAINTFSGGLVVQQDLSL